MNSTLLSFTITEKGYGITDSHGNLLPLVRHELKQDPLEYHSNTMMLISSLLLHRFLAGGSPLTLLSCDNFSRNGDKLKDSVTTIAEEWVEESRAPAEFLTWLRDQQKVTFPISVIDKITPSPSVEVSNHLSQLGFEDMSVTSPWGRPLAGFVNTEPSEYLLIEDSFAAEKPPFEEFGVILTDRETCEAFEQMKVTTCLNPLHTALALAGCLLRSTSIDAEMRDPVLARFVERISWDEAMPVVIDPGVVSPSDFLTEVIETRFPNPYLPDDPGRIATDTSQKMPIRFGETIRSYQERRLSLENLTAIPLVFAIWCRYLMGVADDGEPFVPSPDPLLSELMEHVSSVRLGQPCDVHKTLEPILTNSRFFGVDLYTTSLAKKTENYFSQMITGPGAVHATIEKVVNTK